MLEMFAKYNALRQRAQNPLYFALRYRDSRNIADPAEALAGAAQGIHIDGGSEGERAALASLVESERQRVEPEALRQELQEAAREGREAKPYTGGPDNDLLFWGQVNGHNAGAGGKALRLVWPTITAEVARLNAAAESEWQAYRVHCARTPLAQWVAPLAAAARQKAGEPAVSQVVLRIAYATMGALLGSQLL